MPGSPQSPIDERRAQQLAALAELGFARVEEAVRTEAVRVGPAWRVSQALSAMGTVVSMAALDRSRDRAEEALGEAWAEMHRVVALLNRFDDASPVSELNREGRLQEAPDELLTVLSRAAGLHRLSGGAFDVTVQPVIDLLRGRRDLGLRGAPPEEQLREALVRVGADRLHVRGRSLQLDGDGMGVTLDGIAKGHVVDAMAAALAQRGVAHYLINAGGDVRSAGTRDGASPWRIAVRDPDRADRPAAVVVARDGAVATSGGYEIHFDDERTCHHIVEARSGRSPNACRSVTVRAPDALRADALATAVFVLGPEAGLSLVARIPGSECLILTAGGALRSPGWPGQIDPGREEPA